MKQCPSQTENQETKESPISQTRIKLVQAENATVRDAIDHLRDDGMTNMAKAVEELLNKSMQISTITLKTNSRIRGYEKNAK